MACSACTMARFAELAGTTWWDRNWKWVVLGGTGLFAVLAVAAWKRSR